MFIKGSFHVNRTSTSASQMPEGRLQDELISNITSYVPHELRTPLVSIMGFTQILMEDLDTMSKEDICNMVIRINKSSERLFRTIEKFISFSEVECICKDETLKKELLNCPMTTNTRVITETVCLMAAKEYRSQNMEFDIEEAELLIDEKYLKMVVTELFDNAMKFSIHDSPLEVKGHIEENKYNLSIKNYGRGMTEEQIANIEPFRQFNRKTLQQNGNGLGLATVKRITEIFGCKFPIDSKVNEYIVYTINFPYEK